MTHTTRLHLKLKQGYNSHNSPVLKVHENFTCSHFCNCKANLPALPAIFFSSSLNSNSSFLNSPRDNVTDFHLHRYIQYFIAKIIVLSIFIRGELPDNPKLISTQSIDLNSLSSNFAITFCHNLWTCTHSQNKCKYVSIFCLQKEHKLSSTKPNLDKCFLVYIAPWSSLYWISLSLLTRETFQGLLNYLPTYLIWKIWKFPSIMNLQNKYIL